MLTPGTCVLVEEDPQLAGMLILSLYFPCGSVLTGWRLHAALLAEDDRFDWLTAVLTEESVPPEPLPRATVRRRDCRQGYVYCFDVTPVRADAHHRFSVRLDSSSGLAWMRPAEGPEDAPWLLTGRGSDLTWYLDSPFATRGASRRGSKW